MRGFLTREAPPARGSCGSDASCGAGMKLWLTRPQTATEARLPSAGQNNVYHVAQTRSDAANPDDYRDPPFNLCVV